MYVCRKRYLGLFLDPVQACNLRCRMCYFSTPAARPVHGRIDMDKVLAHYQDIFPPHCRSTAAHTALPCSFPQRRT